MCKLFKKNSRYVIKARSTKVMLMRLARFIEGENCFRVNNQNACMGRCIYGEEDVRYVPVSVCVESERR